MENFRIEKDGNEFIVYTTKDEFVCKCNSRGTAARIAHALDQLLLSRGYVA